MATPKEPAPVAVPLRREALARLTAPLHRHRGRRSARGIDSQGKMRKLRTVNQNKGHWVTPLLAQRSPLPGNSYFWRTASGSTKPDGTHWTVVAVGAGKEHKDMSNDGRGDGIIIQLKMVLSTAPILRSTG
jgi:hypothetical protein